MLPVSQTLSVTEKSCTAGACIKIFVGALLSMWYNLGHTTITVTVLHVVIIHLATGQ